MRALSLLLLLVVGPLAIYGYVCQSCDGNMCCNIPSNHQYYLTDFCGGSGTTACGYSCGSLRYFTADRQRFGCNSYLNICAKGKCLKAKVIDAGPAAWVEKNAGMPIIDASVPTCQYFTGSQACGWSDRFLITAVTTAAVDDSELGPFNVTEEEYRSIVGPEQLAFDARHDLEMQKLKKVQDEPCCSPDQWEAYSFSFDEQHHFRAGLNISYDYTNHRLRILMEQRHGPERRRTIESIALYDSKTLYIVDYTSNTCSKHTLDAGMEQDCVAQDAQLIASVTIGGSLNADIWHFQRIERNETVDLHEVRTSDKCVIVDLFTSSSNLGVDVSYLWDFTPGIKDANVFNPPANCTSGVSLHPKIATLMEVQQIIASGRFSQIKKVKI